MDEEFLKSCCQSCGMPLANQEDFGTNKDGTINKDYCKYCYKEGEFTADCSMEEMIEFCAQSSDQWGIKITKEQAIAWMKEAYPKLKRWKSNQS
ncbi:MAG: zinc ribbon domain-containing protein [Rickettsiales bacterium]|jgi:hypothetical protein|nr:zinc ribbon domain-containing protein [Rickettsiales bacterium]